MKQSNKLIPLMAASLLVACTANGITLQQATEVRDAIRSYTQSVDYNPPQKFTLIDSSEYNGVILELKEVFDAENHYDYRRTRWTEDGVTTESEWWFFFDGAKTYSLMIDTDGVKTRTEEGGNTFDAVRFYDNTWLENWNTIDFYAETLDSVTEDNANKKNIYQSKGDGHLYYKLYLPLENEVIQTFELLFENYNLVKYATDSSLATELYTVDYDNAPTTRPDIQGFPLTSEG